MRPTGFREHPALHSALSNVQIDQHHIRPSNIEISNILLKVFPLPGGPGVWDIPVPLDALVARFCFRSVRTVAEGGGKAGICGIATRNQTHASSIVLGGYGSIADTAMNTIYTKPGGSLYLSDKMFDSTGSDISLTDIWLTLTDPATRVLRTTWTNFSTGLRTLNIWAEIEIRG